MFGHQNQENLLRYLVLHLLLWGKKSKFLNLSLSQFPYLENRDDKIYLVRIIYKVLKRFKSRASLVAQWLKIRLPVQGTRVRALVGGDLTCCGATKPMRHNY